MRLSIEAVSEIAQKIERNAAIYYEKAAGLFPAFEAELVSLKKMEEVHEEIFLKMQDQLEEEQLSKLAPDPFGELDSYLQVFADTSGGEGRPAEFNRLTGSESFQEVLKRSIELENESIKFYKMLEKAVPENSRHFIETIVVEEQKHIASLKLILVKNAG